MDGAAVDAETDNAAGEMVHHDQDPVSSERRFAAEQITTPQTVLGVTEKCKPGRAT